MMVGDLGRLTAEQRVIYYMDLCRSLGLNPMSKPFDYMNLKGKLVLYAKKDCAEQLRKRDNVSIIKLDTELSEGVYIVTAYARNGEGRQDTDVGVVSIENLRGEDKSNAMMKAITKAKRRVTLSICGLGFLDETEIDSIPDARPVRVDIETGVIEGETRPVETKPQPAPQSPADALAAEYKRLYSKAVDLGLPLTKDGHPLPPAIPPTSGKLAMAVDYLRGMVAQAEQMADAPETQAA
jgi:hypothetical protein